MREIKKEGEYKMPVYQINKGINRSIEFKGLKAQYIGYLAGGLVILLLLFTILYICGTPASICILLILGLGGVLFYQVYQLSNRYGQYGLMKKGAKRYLPAYLKFKSRKLFTSLNQTNHGRFQ